MNITRSIVFLLILVFVLLMQTSKACSMYKVTANGKTMVGCNQDAWRTTTSIWFEKSTKIIPFGACFTGSRLVGPNKFTPHSGMNEEGLSFSRLSSYHPKRNGVHDGKLKISNEAEYLKDILHHCATIDDVRKYISIYDHSFFIEDVFMYVDKTGRYLIVEPYQMIEGNDPSYVLSNFCPSFTDNETARKFVRYRNGEDFIEKYGIDSSLDFCSSLSDTMSVCRKRNGDGTLLTSIWNAEEGTVNLYFYHSFETTVQFNIKEELKKGYHIISIPEIFPPNTEFQRLVDYQTPKNNNSIKLGLALTGGLFLFLALFYFISYIRNKSKRKYNWLLLLFICLNVILFPYLLELATNINIFYMDAPYKSHYSQWVTLSSYIPFLMAVIILPIIFYSYKFSVLNRKNIWIKASIIVNSLLYIVLLFGFVYWGFYVVF